MNFSICAVFLICVTSCQEICPRDVAQHFPGSEKTFTHYSDINTRLNLTLELVEGADRQKNFIITKHQQTFILNELELITLRSKYFKNTEILFANINYKFDTEKYMFECINTDVIIGHLSLQACRMNETWLFGFIRDQDSLWISYPDLKALMSGLTIAQEKLFKLHMTCDVRMKY